MEVFWKIIDCHWIINVNVCMRSVKLSVKHKQRLSNCAEIATGTKISGGTNILRTSRYWFPIGFFSKSNTVLFLKRLGFIPCKAEQPLHEKKLQESTKKITGYRKSERKNLQLKDVC